MKITLGQLVGIIVLIVIVGVGAYIGTSKLKNKSADGGKTRQAVFLTNNQVYFGYVTKPESKTVTLKDVYYLQVNQNLQEGKDQKAADQQLSLVKLGNELHGPVDEMHINRDAVLFIEDMKGDSKVNQAIADFIKNGSPTATPIPAATQ